MLSLEALRQAAQTAPAVLVPSDTLLDLLDLAAKVEKKTKAVKATREVDPEDERCARWLFGVVKQTVAAAREPSFSAWANDIRLMRERDARTHREICELFQWAHSDSFWCTNILCPKTLRDKWTRLAARREQTTPGLRTVPSLGKAGAATAQNAARWLEEHGDAA